MAALHQCTCLFCGVALVLFRCLRSVQCYVMFIHFCPTISIKTNSLVGGVLALFQIFSILNMSRNKKFAAIGCFGHLIIDAACHPNSVNCHNLRFCLDIVICVGC